MKKLEDREECISYDVFLSKIADELSFNYVTVSFGETHKDGLIHGIDKPHELYKNIFNQNENPVLNRGSEKKCRNILVIGSGATHDSYASIPLGSETKRLLGKKLNLQSLLETNKEFRDKFEDDAKRILSMRLGKLPDENGEPIIDHPKFDFESYLLLMTKFFREQDIRKALHEMFNVRHAPCLFYEITAHLFKHRFFDIIINFNFDELLDQSIKEEMGTADYHVIISDGDCKEIHELIVDGRLKIPVYIKPHGTISHKSTLRFTKDHYFDLPDDIKRLLNELFEGKLSETSKGIERVNVVTAGFNLDSIEFNDILKKNRKKVKIYSITHSDKPELFMDENANLEEDLFKHDKKFRLLPTIFGTTSLQINKDSKPMSLGTVFYDLFEKITLRFNDLYKPRSITRHLIFNEIFYNKQYGEKDENGNPIISYKEIENKYSSSAHFKNRAIIELSIALARGRGRIELKELMSDRLGESYKLYRKTHQQEKYNGLPDSLYDLAEIFKLKEEYSFSRNVHNISQITLEEASEFKETFELIFGKKYTEEYLKENPLKYYSKCIIFRLLTARQTPENLHDLFLDDKGQYNVELINEITLYFNDLYETGYYQDVNARFNDSKLYIFDHYYMDQILHTSLSYSYRFNEVFLAPDCWDYLLFVSDTGSILNRLHPYIDNPELFKNKKICLISCLEAIKTDTGRYSPLLDIIGNRTAGFRQYEEIGCEIIHKTLPYSEHHHHITIFLKKVPNSDNNDSFVYELSKFPTIQVSNQKGKIENFIFSRSIYFYQKGFNSEINPLWVRGAFAFLKDKNTPLPSNFATNLLVKDHIMLLETFYAYYKKAGVFEITDGKYIEYLLPKQFDLGNTPSETLKSRKFDIGDLFSNI